MNHGVMRRISRLCLPKIVTSRPIVYDSEFQDLGAYSDSHCGIWMSNYYKMGALMELIDQGLSVFGLSSFFQGSFTKSEETIGEILGKIKPEEYVHRVGERGVFLCFKESNTRDIALKLLEESDDLGSSIILYPVKGLPYIEDLFFRTRSTKLSVKNIDKKLTEEEVFDIFRPYGKILEILFSSGSAEVHYLKKRSAIDARCCLHRFSLLSESSQMNIEFLKHHRIRLLLGYIKSPKLLPIVILLITLLLIILVEPVRLFNCARSLSVQTRTKKSDLYGDQYLSMVGSFRLALDTCAPSLFTVTGARGCGKSSFVDKAIRKRRLTTKIDFSEVKTTEEMINVIERSISYRPTFRTFNSIVKSIESLIPGTNSISRNEEQQVERILRTMEISLGFAKIFSKDRKAVLVFDSVETLDMKSGSTQARMMNQILTWCENIEERGLAHIVFVCSHNFVKYHLQRSQSLGNRIKQIRVPELERNDVLRMVLKKRNEYVSGSVENGNKEKKFGFFRVLREYFRNRKGLRRASGDYDDDVENGEEFEEMNKYPAIGKEEVKDWKEIASIIGGKDLSLLLELTRRVEVEGSVKKVYRNMVNEIKDEVLTRGFGEKMFEEEFGVIGWSKIVLWKTMNRLVENQGFVPYDDLLLNQFYGKAGDLKNLVEAKILSLEVKDNVLVVKPFNHVVGVVFQDLVKDERMKKRMKEFEEYVEFEKNLEIASKMGRGCTIL